MVPVSLDYSFLMDPLVFSNVYLATNRDLEQYKTNSQWEEHKLFPMEFQQFDETLEILKTDINAF